MITTEVAALGDVPLDQHAWRYARVADGSHGRLDGPIHC
jgi:hypothetical protein